MGNQIGASVLRIRRQLLDWYVRNRRELPWRRNQDPYAIWISEIMLQQTRVAAVVEHYAAFMKRFPTLASLAEASEQELLALWSGLGYYRRARMLLRAAQIVVACKPGKLPVKAAQLRLLPGIGDYTAAAIASIAHGEPVAVVDGNVMRVLCRMEGWAAAGLGGGKSLERRRIVARANELLDPAHPGNFNQAMMELGATVCLPRNPLCEQCPVVADCSTRGEHPTAPRAPIERQPVAYALILRQRGKQSRREILLEQRLATQGVMPEMWELPTLKETEVPPQFRVASLRHVIMKVNYAVQIRSVDEAEAAARTVASGKREWIWLGEVETMALTGLTRKVLRHVHLLETAIKARLRVLPLK